MAKIHKWIAAVLCSIILAHISYANERAEGAERRPKDDSKYLQNVIVDTENIVVDKQLLDIYVRLMRYQTAGQDIAKYLGGKESKPEDYLTIAVDNVQIGKKGELSRYLNKVYSQRSNEILQILRNETCPEGESCSLSYAVEWVSAPDASARFTYPSEKGVVEYITYNLTASYKGKSASHSGLILYYKSEKPEVDFFVYDGIIPQINMAAMDRLPLAKVAKRQSARAFRQAMSKKEVKKLKAIKIDGQHLESENEDHPIGYLPGDEERIIDEPLLVAIQTLCGLQCQYPTGEGTEANTAVGNNGAGTQNGLHGGFFKMTLQEFVPVPAGKYANRIVGESWGSTTDGCYQANQGPRMPDITNTDTWTIDSNNQYGVINGYEFLGVSGNWVGYYLANATSACSATANQTMKMNCNNPQPIYQYETHQGEWIIDNNNGLHYTIKRDGASVVFP